MTTQSNALGQWPNAPLAIVLAQIRFEPGPATEYTTLADKIRLATGDEFPVTNKVQQFSFVVGDGGQPSGSPEASIVAIDLRNDADRRSLRIQPGALTYSTSKYSDSGHFLSEWRKLLDILCHEGDVRVLRLGLRYVDFIIPTPGKVPEDYLVGFGRSPEALGDQAPVAYSFYDYERANGGQLRIQYGRGFGPPVLPPDLMDSVPPPPFLVAKYSGGLSAVLDMDRWRPAAEVMSVDRIAEEFQLLRDDLAETFHRIISPAAVTEWQKRTSQEI